MTHDSREQSLDNGEPISLAFFVCDAFTLRICSADMDVVAGGHIWHALPGATFPNVRDTSEVRAADLRLVVPVTFAIAQHYLVAPPMRKIGVFLYDYHYGETEKRQAWMGHVGNVKWDGKASAEILLANGHHALDIMGLPDALQRHCRHTVYSPGCRVPLGARATDATLSGSGLLYLEAPEFAALPDHWFQGGILQWVSPQGIPDYRFIRKHVGNRIETNWRVARLPLDGGVIAHAGCNGTQAHCGPKFNNSFNFGGFDRFRPKNPFDGLEAPVY
jgi:uncharacterized phage protein (TIGR02218 family)